MPNQALAAHVLYHLAVAQKKGRPMTLLALSQAVGVRRPDVRSVVSALHREAVLDATTLRLTFSGFALGASLRRVALPRLPRLFAAPAARRPARVVAAA